MIKITNITLTDFGGHKRIDSSISGHVVGLTGPNGRGKTTVLQAIQFAMTGTIDTDPMEPMRAFIRRATGDNPPKSMQVDMEFVADGKKGKISRKVTKTTSTRSLSWEGLPADPKTGSRATLTSESQVNELFLEILGVDKKAINSTVFIRQGELTRMFSKDAERRDFYTRLLMLGSLEKISDVVEAHRATVASSVQDLGVARDAANAAYEESAAYFEQCETTLKGLPAQDMELQTARRFLQLMTEHAAAEDALQDAEKRLAAVNTSGDVSWLESEKSMMAQLSLELVNLTEARDAHFKARTAAAEAETAWQSAQESVRMWAALESAEAELARVGIPGEDPADELAKCADSLKWLDQLEALKESTPALQAKVAELQRVSDTCKATYEYHNTIYLDARLTYSQLAESIKLQKELKSKLDGLSKDGACMCPVCGSGTPDLAFLDRSIESLKDQLKLSEEEGVEIAKKVQELRAENTKATVAYHDAFSRLCADEETLKRLRVSTAFITRRGVLDLVEKLKAKQEEFSAKAIEFRRLTTAVRDAKVAVQRVPKWNTDALKTLETAKYSTKTYASTKPWDAEDEEQRVSVSARIASMRVVIQQAEAAATSQADAQRRLATITEAVVAAMPPSEFFADVCPADTALTMAEVRRKVEALEAAQKQHDTAKGSYTAANDRLRDASRKLDELDLRAAEQVQRLKLVEDLVRLRDTFRPTGASLEYLTYKFKQIAKMAGDYLAESGADFMVAASPDVPLYYEFLRTDRPDETWLGQNRLSGGQKVRLAVATLRAIHALIMPNVGLLVLDEPTTHLDEEAKRAMADMLHKIGNEGNLQIIVCDHSPILVDAFSDLIQLPD